MVVRFSLHLYFYVNRNEYEIENIILKSTEKWHLVNKYIVKNKTQKKESKKKKG